MRLDIMIHKLYLESRLSVLNAQIHRLAQGESPQSAIGMLLCEKAEIGNQLDKLDSAAIEMYNTDK
jgi:hypothetical protein